MASRAPLPWRRWAIGIVGALVGLGVTFGGVDELTRVVLALVACAPIALISAWLSVRSVDASLTEQLAAILGGSLARMAVTLAIALVAYWRVPACRDLMFWVWVVGFYFLAMALEVTEVLAAVNRREARRRGDNQPGASV